MDTSLHTEPGGPSMEVRDGALLLRKQSVSEMHNNVYLLACAASGQSLLVDAADDAPLIRELATGTLPLAVVQTHGHWDHVRAWADLASDPGLEIWGHEGDLELYPQAPDRLLTDGQELAVGELSVEVLHVPGHTSGSLLLLVHGSEPAVADHRRLAVPRRAGQHVRRCDRAHPADGRARAARVRPAPGRHGRAPGTR
jgi:glyoxylase-like metal-dependent hydrolase (beta-lactamase superfamily II)